MPISGSPDSLSKTPKRTVTHGRPESTMLYFVVKPPRMYSAVESMMKKKNEKWLHNLIKIIFGNLQLTNRVNPYPNIVG